jgi:hypothetical protein
VTSIVHWVLTNLLRGVTWLTSPGKGPTRLITWHEISAVIEHCLKGLEQSSDTCQSGTSSEVTEQCWLLSVLYQHIDLTAVTLANDAPMTPLHRRVTRSAVQHMTRVIDPAHHLPLLRVLNVLLVDWHVSSWSECGLDEHALLSLVRRCLSSTAA